MALRGGGGWAHEKDKLDRRLSELVASCEISDLSVELTVFSNIHSGVALVMSSPTHLLP